MTAAAPTDDIWEAALSDVPPLDNDEELTAAARIIGEDTPQEVNRATWRREITANGKFWQWRKGSKQNRRSRYGGTTQALFSANPELREQYEHNRKREAVRKRGTARKSKKA